MPHIVLYAIGGVFGIMAVYNAGKIDPNLQLQIMICMWAFMGDSILKTRYHHRQLINLKKGWDDMVMRWNQGVVDNLKKELEDGGNRRDRQGGDAEVDSRSAQKNSGDV